MQACYAVRVCQLLFIYRYMRPEGPEATAASILSQTEMVDP